MSKQRIQYNVAIQEDAQTEGALRLSFVPKPTATSARTASPAPEYAVSIRHAENTPELEWINRPADETTFSELTRIAEQRMALRKAWLSRLDALVEKVKVWAEGLEWATRRIEKKMEDAEIGRYVAPALLLQKDTVRLFLEPVARVAPRTEGVVDLYLMPSYDDIASLYFYDGRWHVHYMFEGTATVGNIREAEARPLTKATLQKVFDEMTVHAG